MACQLPVFPPNCPMIGSRVDVASVAFSKVSRFLLRSNFGSNGSAVFPLSLAGHFRVQWVRRAALEKLHPCPVCTCKLYHLICQPLIPFSFRIAVGPFPARLAILGCSDDVFLALCLTPLLPCGMFAQGHPLLVSAFASSGSLGRSHVSPLLSTVIKQPLTIYQAVLHDQLYY